MRNMLKTLMTATEEYVPLKRELLGIEPDIFISVATKCGFEPIYIEDENMQRVILRQLGVPKVFLYDQNESDEFCFLNLSDFHVGHKDFDEESLLSVLRKYYEKVKNAKHKYVFIAGDACDAIYEEGLSYELVQANDTFGNKVKKEHQIQREKLYTIFSSFPLDYIALNGNHEYMFVQLGLQSPLAVIEARLRNVGINYTFYDTYIMDFIIAGITLRVMHLEGHLYKEGRNPIYERINQFKNDRLLSCYYNGKKYPVRIIQSGHRHKRQILYDSSSKVYAIEAGSFLKNEMYGKPQMIQGQVGKNGIVTLL